MQKEANFEERIKIGNKRIINKLLWSLFCFGFFVGIFYWFYINMEELIEEKREEDMVLIAHK
jgi:hypothetical protein